MEVTRLYILKNNLIFSKNDFKNSKAKETIIKENQAPIENNTKSLINKSKEDVLEKLKTIDIKIGKEHDKEVSPYEIP
jgi:hypothetical protein